MKTFLIVDDNEEFLGSLSYILQRHFKIYKAREYKTQSNYLKVLQSMLFAQTTICATAQVWNF